MSSAVLLTCPNCGKSLRVPPEWADRAVRCKFCGTSFQARKKGKAAPPAASVPLAEEVPTADAVVATGRTAPMPARPNLNAWQAAASAPPQLPEYSPPRPAAPAAPAVEPLAPGGYTPAFGASAKKHAGRKYKPASGGTGKWVALALVVLLLGGGFAGVYFAKPEWLGIKKKDGTPPPDGPGPDGPPGGDPTKPAGKGDATGEYPRRLLAVSIHNYLNANPLGSGDNGAEKESDRRDVHAAMKKLAERWHVRPDQFYHLSDVPTTDMRKADTKHAPFKNVVKETVEKFLDTSRDQDRVVLVLVGHAVEKDGEAFFATLESELEEPETMLSISKWLYPKLAACKAEEKFVVFDVARFNPTRGAERPTAGPLSDGLAKALHAPEGGLPPRAAVFTSCSPGEYSYEFDYAYARQGEIYGGVFLSQIFTASIKAASAKSTAKLQSPADKLPVEGLTEFLSKETGLAVKALVPAGKDDADKPSGQTPKFTDNRKDDLVAYSNKIPMPARFELPKAPDGADRKLVTAIFDEIEVPNLKATRKDGVHVRLADLMPFEASAIEPYKEGGGLKPDDIAKDKFKSAVASAVAEVRKMKAGDGEEDLPEMFNGETNDAAIKRFKRVQEIPAVREAILREQVEALEAVAEMKEKQPKRWQAHYEYVLAQVKMRIAYTQEYNLVLGKLAKKELPEKGPDDVGYRLAAVEKLSAPVEYRTMAEEGKNLLAEVVKNHPNTPWAVMAKQERNLRLGLKWQPYSEKKAGR